MDRSASLLRIVRTANVGQIEGLLGSVNVNVKDRMGRTPLHLAVAFNKNPEVVRALLRHDEIDVNAVDELGRSPLHLCVNSHKEELLRPGEASRQSAAAMAQFRENIELMTGRVDLNYGIVRSYEDYDNDSGGDYEDDDNFSHPGGTGYSEGVELKLARMLMEKGADVNIAARVVNVTPLHLAARLGQVEMVKLLLTDPKLDLEKPTVDKHTVLHLVAEGHQRTHIPAGMKKPTMEDLCEIIRMIREARPTGDSTGPKSKLVNMVDRLGLTVLHFAARDGCVTLVKELLAFNETNDRFEKIDVNIGDAYTFTALHLAVLGGYTAEDFLNRPKANFKMGPLTAVIELLLKVPGIDINLKAPVQRVTYDDLEAFTEIHTDYFFRPMSYPFPVSGAWDNTALHLACKDGRDAMVRLLLHRKVVNLKLSNSHNQTALQLATYNGHLEVVNQVLVHYAAREGYRNVVETLLPHVDKDEREMEERKIIEAFLKAKEEELGNVQDLDTKPLFTILIDLLGIASEQRHREVATFLVETLDRSTLVMAERGARKGNLLHWAAENGELAIVQDVMTPESINSQDEAGENEAGFTALHYAILGRGDPAKRENCFQVLKELLSSPDLDVNSHGVYGKTPLHIAVAKNDVAVVRLLCTEVGERLRANEVDDKDKTPLEIAVENLKSFSETAEALRLAIKADKTKTQEEKKKAMEAAIDKKRETAMRQIEMLLLDRGDVQDYMDRLYRDRQMYVDASNSLLVGAALIAGVAFVGWLQPPSGYTDEGVVKTSTSALCFFLFNALAFFGGMGAVISGADGALLDEETFIRAALETTRSALMWTISLLIISVVCVLGAFVSAGVVVFPLATTKQRVCFFLTLVVGVVMCFVSVFKFAIKVLKKMKNRTRLYKSKHLNEDDSFLP